MTDLASAEYVETVLMPQLGFNTELLAEQPACVKAAGGGWRIWQYPNQFSKYLQLLRELRPTSYVEIGCRWGGTFMLTCEYLMRVGCLRRATAFDLDSFPVEEYCAAESAATGVDLTFAKMDSQSKQFQDRIRDMGPIDVILIDGDHSYEGVKSDFDTVSPHCETFVFHYIDSDACPGVVRFWNELKLAGKDAFDFTEFTEQYEDVKTATGGRKYLGIGVAKKKKESLPCVGEESPAKIAYITAVIGDYEQSLKKFASQTVASDFIAFVDHPLPDSACNGWKVDTHAYHDTHRPPIWAVNLFNGSSQHPFFLAKYYKQCAWCIPRLAKYDVIVWLDGTIEITNPRTSEIIMEKMRMGNAVVGWQHEFSSTVAMEADLSVRAIRYASPTYLGKEQKPQRIAEQVRAYTREGFEQSPQHWVTCFVAFNAKLPVYRALSMTWFSQTLTWSTQDQVSFPYACWKVGVTPYTFPDADVGGLGHSKTDLYIKHAHGI